MDKRDNVYLISMMLTFFLLWNICDFCDSFLFIFLALQFLTFNMPISCWCSVLEHLFTIYTLSGRFHPHSWFLVSLTSGSTYTHWLPNTYLLAWVCETWIQPPVDIAIWIFHGSLSTMWTRHHFPQLPLCCFFCC